MEIVEYIRGLGMGGAEALLVSRLSAPDAPASTTTIVNTYPAQDHHAAALRDAGVKVRSTSHGTLAGLAEVWRSAAKASADAVIISHSPSITLLLQLRKLLRLGRRQRLVAVVHNSNFRGIYQWLGRVLNRQADIAICVGDQVVDSPGAAGYRGKIVVRGGVPTGTFTNWFESHPRFRDDVRARVGARPDDHVLVTVGGLTSVKNQALLIRSLPHLGERFRLAVIGDGVEAERLATLARDLDAPVTFLGWQEDAWRWIGSADALVHGSRFEGLPVVLMEAAALDVPIAATPFEGAQEVSETGSRVSIATSFEPSDFAKAVRELSLQDEDHASRSPRPYWDHARFAKEFYSAALTVGHPTGHQHGVNLD